MDKKLEGFLYGYIEIYDGVAQHVNEEKLIDGRIASKPIIDYIYDHTITTKEAKKILHYIVAKQTVQELPYECFICDGIGYDDDDLCELCQGDGFIQVNLVMVIDTKDFMAFLAKEFGLETNKNEVNK